MEITSTTNNLVKETAKLAQKKFRTETGLFLIEGQKAVTEAEKLGVKLEKIFILKDKTAKYTKYSDAIYVNEAVMKKIATTETAPEIIATAKQLIFSEKDLIKKSKIVYKSTRKKI